MFTDDKRKKIIFSMLRYLLLLLIVFSILYPILGVFFGSFKTKIEFLSTNGITPPKNWTNFENYKVAFSQGQILTGFKNTVVIIVFACVTSTLFNTMVAYCFSRFEFKGKAILDKIYLLASFVPGTIVHLIIFKDFVRIGLTDHLSSIVILYSGVDIVSLYLYKQYLSQIPFSIDESAMMEGSSFIGIYFKILLPMLKPAVVTACIIKTTYIYNDFYTSYLYLSSTQKGVMSTVLYRFIGPYSAQWSVIAAGIILVTMPVFLTFIFAQKYIYKGFSDGAVKE